MSISPLAVTFASALICSLALGAAALVYIQINQRTRQAFPRAGIPAVSRFRSSKERLTLSLYRQAFPRSPLIAVYHALLWLATAAFLVVPLAFLVALVHRSQP